MGVKTFYNPNSPSFFDPRSGAQSPDVGGGKEKFLEREKAKSITGERYKDTILFHKGHIMTNSNFNKNPKKKQNKK